MSVALALGWTLFALQSSSGDEGQSDLRAFAVFAAITVGAVFFLVSTAVRARAIRRGQASLSENTAGGMTAGGETAGELTAGERASGEDARGA